MTALRIKGGRPRCRRSECCSARGSATWSRGAPTRSQRTSPPGRRASRSISINCARRTHRCWLISCADELHNSRAILADYRRHGEALWDRFNAGRDDILWSYRTLARQFAEDGPDVLATQLAQVVATLEAEADPR